jgi:hypothetical protein
VGVSPSAGKGELVCCCGKVGPRPLLLIVGREAVTAWMSVGAHQPGGLRRPRRSRSHVDLYDRDEYVTPAVAKLTDF